MAKGEKEKVVFLLYVAVLLCLAGVHSPGLAIGSPFWHRLVYPFVHANIYHLIGNAYCIVLLAFKMEQKPLSLLVGYMISVCVPVLWGGVVIGASGVCYSMMGWNYWIVLRKRYYMAWMLGFIALGFAIPAFAGFVHLWCYVLGMLFGWLCRKR